MFIKIQQYLSSIYWNAIDWNILHVWPALAPTMAWDIQNVFINFMKQEESDRYWKQAVFVPCKRSNVVRNIFYSYCHLNVVNNIKSTKTFLQQMDNCDRKVSISWYNWYNEEHAKWNVQFIVDLWIARLDFFLWGN